MPKAHWRAKLTREIVDEMRAARASGATVQAIWLQFGLPRGMSYEGVRAVLRWQCWK